MPQKIKEVSPPRGIARWFYRLPILLYQVGIGWILGHRFLLLTHKGRRSGLPRSVVLEVVRFDKLTESFVVAAGFGPSSDWYRNIQADPMVTVQSGGLKWKMKTNFISIDQAGQEMVDYAKKHPIAAMELPGVMGYKLDGSEDDYRAFGKTLNMVLFTREIS